MPKAKLPIAALDGTERVDDRWTLTKLREAGYQLEWEKDCRTCGDQIEAYRKTGTGGLLILDSTVLTPHSCEGR